EQGLSVIGHTDAAVKQADEYLVLRDLSREREFAVLLRQGVHGVARVHDQVEEDLLELHAVSHGGRNVAGDEIPYSDAALYEIAANEAEQFSETLIHTHRLECHLTA